MSIPMKCCHRDHKGEIWNLNLGDEQAELHDPDGNVRGTFTRDEAAHQFLMPSFSESIKQFRIPVDGQTWYFDVAKDDLQQIRTYIDHSLVASGPEALRAVRNAAIRDLVIGVIFAIIGVGLTVASHMGEDDNAYIVYGPVLVGLIMVGKAIYGFVRFNRLKSMAVMPSS